MTTIKVKSISTYSNSGLRSEQNLVYTLTGEIRKHDSVPFDCGSDIPEYNMSVKSARFSLTTGTLFTATTFEGQIEEYFARVHSTQFAYVTKDNTAYIMNADEFKDFLMAFGRMQRDSAHNGGNLKIRAAMESKKMLAYLAERV